MSLLVKVFMEKVNGVRFDKFMPTSIEDKKIICTKAFDSIRKLHKLGIKHGDFFIRVM